MQPLWRLILNYSVTQQQKECKQGLDALKHHIKYGNGVGASGLPRRGAIHTVLQNVHGFVQTERVLCANPQRRKHELCFQSNIDQASLKFSDPSASTS